MALNTQSALAKDTRSGLGEMQHRHFATIATIIREMQITDEMRDTLAKEFAARLSSTNSNFNARRFLTACRKES